MHRLRAVRVGTQPRDLEATIEGLAATYTVHRFKFFSERAGGPVEPSLARAASLGEQAVTVTVVASFSLQKGGDTPSTSIGK